MRPLFLLAADMRELSLLLLLHRTYLRRMTGCFSSACTRQATTRSHQVCWLGLALYCRERLLPALSVACSDGGAVTYSIQLCRGGILEHVFLCTTCAGPAGGLEEVGKGAGTGYTLNVPLPPGSGSGAYRAAFDRVVAPALDAFQPELILVSAGRFFFSATPYCCFGRCQCLLLECRLVSLQLLLGACVQVQEEQQPVGATCARRPADWPDCCALSGCVFVCTGYDASYMDPLGHMMLGSEDYRYFMQVMQVRASVLNGQLQGCSGLGSLTVSQCAVSR
jgi:hypothetical protein